MHNRKSWNCRIIVAPLALLALLIGACVPITSPPAVQGPGQAATTNPTEEEEMLSLEGVTWRLTEFADPDGTSASAVADATLTFEEDRPAATLAATISPPAT